MTVFLDTSVFVAAFWEGHPDHEASLELLSTAHSKRAACAAHSLAEIYATMTALPIKDRIPPEHVMLFLKEVRDRCRLVTLSEDEYWKTIARVAELGLTSGQVYDALLLECARKSRANTIYTWNLRHFRAVAPELADRILHP